MPSPKQLILLALIVLTVIGAIVTTIFLVHRRNSKGSGSGSPDAVKNNGGVVEQTPDKGAWLLSTYYIDFSKVDYNDKSTWFPAVSNTQKLSSSSFLTTQNSQIIFTHMFGNIPIFLTPNQTPDQKYLIMRPQGDAVVVDSVGNVLWSSQTTTGVYLAFQDDNNIVIYDVNSKPIWAQTNLPGSQNLWQYFKPGGSGSGPLPRPNLSSLQGLDCGYEGFQAWYDISNQGVQNDFCRLVGTDKQQFWACIPAGTDTSNWDPSNQYYVPTNFVSTLPHTYISQPCGFKGSQ